MGIETALIIGAGVLTGASVIGGMKAADAQAKQIVRQGEAQARSEARKTKLLAGEQRASFLSSGLTLEGTPMDFINETYNTGIQDTRQILDNARAQSKNVVKQARNAAIGQIAGFAMSAATMGATSGASAASSAGTTGVTNTAAVSQSVSSAPAFSTSFPSPPSFGGF